MQGLHQGFQSQALQIYTLCIVQVIRWKSKEVTFQTEMHQVFQGRPVQVCLDLKHLQVLFRKGSKQVPLVLVGPVE